MVLAMVPAAPPMRKNRRATSWPAPISANVPYLAGSRLICSAFLSVAISISGVMQFLLRRFSTAANCGHPSRSDGFGSRRFELDCWEAVILEPPRTRDRRCLLQSHLLGVFRGNPTAQIIRQPCVDPVAASA